MFIAEVIDQEQVNPIIDQVTTRRPTRPTRPQRPAVFPPKSPNKDSQQKPETVNGGGVAGSDRSNDNGQIKVAGPSFLPPFGKRPYVKPEPENQDPLAGPKRQETEISDKINPAIVEGIPGKALTAEDTDPETRCQNTCGQNEICQINHDGIECKCRPGFGRTSKTGSLCESKLSYLVVSY